MHRDLVPDELCTQTRDLTQCRHEYDKLASFMQEDQEKKGDEARHAKCEPHDFFGER